jgi:iron complex transport system permease protein
LSHQKYVSLLRKKFLLLFFLLVGLVLLNVSVGAVKIPFYDLIAIAFGSQENEIWYHIFWYFRLPKILTAILAGVALSVSGLLMQTFFANPLASPSELGISAGASLGVASLTLSSGISWVSLQSLGFSGYSLVAVLAIAGAALVMFLMLGMALQIRSTVALLIIGLMLSSLVISLIAFWQFMSSPEQIRDFLWWSFGSLSNTNYSQIGIMSTGLLLAFLIILKDIQAFNVLLLGEQYAQTMGISLKNLRWKLILSVSIMTGIVTAFCGPIGFIGIAVPHLARRSFRSANHWVLVPATAMLGAILLLFCDILAHFIYPNFSLPINTITSLIGSPIIIWVVAKRQSY